MNSNEEALIQEGWELFTRVFMKYDVLGKAPMEIGPGEKLSASLLHVVEAIGKGHGNTVTALSNYFMVTKGGVSQMITKLHQLGYLAKTKRKGNDKEIVLKLTKKGWKAYELHEKRNEPTLTDLKQFLHRYKGDELLSFLSILTGIEQVLNNSILQQAEK